MNFEKITQYLDSLMDRDIPGADCIIYKDHEMVYRHMFGTSDVNHKTSHHLPVDAFLPESEALVEKKTQDASQYVVQC